MCETKNDNNIDLSYLDDFGLLEDTEENVFNDEEIEELIRKDFEEFVKKKADVY